MVGKVVEKLVQSRLQLLAERVLPESQCGFMVCQLAEKATEHQTQQYRVFVYLWKAYNSVSCEALRASLKKLRVLNMLMDVLMYFHSHTCMKARIRMDGNCWRRLR